jgi:sugar (pentulose or hexulose) kinase
MTLVWLGIDLGTQGCRVAAVGDDGALLASAASPLHSERTTAGGHEQDPRSWKSAVASACRATLARLESRDVTRLAICGTSGTLLLGDRLGRPLTPALMYDDSRAAAELPPLADAWAACEERNAYRIQPTWALPKLRWLLRNVEEASAARLYHCPDFIASWLIGEAVATDSSHALKTGYDLVDDRWPEEAFEAVGIPPSVLPHVVRPGTLLGGVGAAGAEATGLVQGTPVVAGMTDGCASQIASGTLRAGDWNCALGTTFVLKGVSTDLLRDPAGAVYSHRHPDGGWLPGGASNSGAGALSNMFADADLATLDHAAAARGPTEVVQYPLAKPGERFPFVRGDAEPFRLGHPLDEVEAFTAVLQGVAFVERLSLAYVHALGGKVQGAIAATGGATRSAVWTQLRADVLGRAVRLPKHPETAVGMAIVAAAGCGSVTDAADRMVRVERVFEPRPERTERYLPVYWRMLDELARRGYISADLATTARAA